MARLVETHTQSHSDEIFVYFVSHADHSFESIPIQVKSRTGFCLRNDNNTEYTRR